MIAPIIMPNIMIAPIAVTPTGHLRRVSILALLLVALSVPGQSIPGREAEAPVSGASPLSVPDIVITGEDAIIIVPPLPVLPGGSIPVPRVELQPLPFRPHPTGCDVSDAAPVIEPVCIDLSAFSDWLPFFLAPGEPPIPEMHALGILHSATHSETARDNISAQSNGGDE